MRNRRSVQKTLKFLFSWLPESYDPVCLVASRTGELSLFIEGELYSLYIKIPRFCDSDTDHVYQVDTNQLLCRLFSFVEQNEAVKGLISNNCLNVFSFSNKIEIPLTPANRTFPIIYDRILVADVNALKSALYWVCSECENITSVEIQLGQLKLFSQTNDEEIGCLYKPMFSEYEFYSVIWRKNLEKLVQFVENVSLFKEKPRIVLLESGIGIEFKELALLFNEPTFQKKSSWFSEIKNDARIQCLLVPTAKSGIANIESMKLQIEDDIARLEAGPLLFLGESKSPIRRLELTLSCRNLGSFLKGPEKMFLYVSDNQWAIRKGNLFYAKKQPGLVF